MFPENYSFLAWCVKREEFKTGLKSKKDARTTGNGDQHGVPNLKKHPVYLVYKIYIHLMDQMTIHFDGRQLRVEGFGQRFLVTRRMGQWLRQRMRWIHHRRTRLARIVLVDKMYIHLVNQMTIHFDMRKFQVL